MPQQKWLPPTPEEEALQQPDYTPWDFIQMLLNPSNIAKKGLTSLVKSKPILAIMDKKTGKIFKALENEFIHADMLDRVLKKGVKYEDIDAGFFVPGKGWLSKWTGEKTVEGYLPPKFNEYLVKGKSMVPPDVLKKWTTD